MLEKKLCQAPENLKLDFFSQMNFIGLFVKENMYDFLQDCVSVFSKELSKGGEVLNVFIYQKKNYLLITYKKKSQEERKQIFCLEMIQKIYIVPLLWSTDYRVCLLIRICPLSFAVVVIKSFTFSFSAEETLCHLNSTKLA